MSSKLGKEGKNQQHLRIVLTGGGTAGHVMPHLAILPELRRVGFSVYYIGSGGVEKGLAHGAGIPFFQISTGKLRRYLSVQNVLDVFRIVVGFFQSVLLMLRLKPDVVFSKGGFVAVPVTLAAWICRVPVVTHESD
jgi:UDP-N-acetylglucosamine--N-acetylmuramyl-(pentapeptide) pyrophosphoryl-undecaprenol N-acetylglucosamine transferase